MKLSEGFECLIYPGENARPRMTTIRNIYEEDAQYFNRIGAKTSMEPIGNQYALYADIGLTHEDGTPNEVLVLSGTDTSENSFKKLREACENLVAHLN